MNAYGSLSCINVLIVILTKYKNNEFFVSHFVRDLQKRESTFPFIDYPSWRMILRHTLWQNLTHFSMKLIIHDLVCLILCNFPDTLRVPYTFLSAIKLASSLREYTLIITYFNVDSAFRSCEIISFLYHLRGKVVHVYTMFFLSLYCKWPMTYNLPRCL